MATGKSAFDGDRGSVRQEAILKQTPSPVRSVNRKIPAKLEAIINRALEKDRDVRYQSAAAIVADLERLKPGRKPIRLVAAAGATIVAIGLAVSGWLFFSHKAHALTNKDAIVLADFTNTTGDPVFDGTLRQGLSIQLEQSPFLSIVSERQIQETLQMMEQKPDTRLTPKIARELLPENGEYSRSRWLDCTAGHPVRSRTQGGELSQRRFAGGRASASERQGASAKCARRSGSEAASRARGIADHSREVQHAD